MTTVKYPSIASEFVALRSYCRWLPEENRRETWREVTSRTLDFLKTETRHGDRIPNKVWTSIEEGMLNFNTMPSMRLVATAGPAAKRNNISLFNCSYLPVSDFRAFGEILLLLSHGCGVGFSVEAEYINKLPVVKHATSIYRDDYTIEDTREGWANAVLFAIETYYNGEDVHFNYSKIRPYGTPLKTFGGRASGPDPLEETINFIKEVCQRACGRRLSSVEIADIVCKVADAIVAGGSRRSATICFTDLEDMAMQNYKKFPIPPHRFMANISAVYKERPDTITFLKEWSSLAESGSGERGIFNISNLGQNNKERKFTKDHRCNPCGEAILRPFGICNLSEAVVKATDDADDLIEKVKTATWLGVIQSTFTNFPGFRPEWKRNAEEERLIGVSLTGQLDNPDVLTDEILKQLKKIVIKTARHASGILGITPPKAHTVVKPSGTVSQVVDSASGCHPRFSKYYIRRYRISKADPLYKLMVDQGMKSKPEVGQTKDNATTMVFEFPIKSPDKAITTTEWSSFDQLNWYLKLQKNWSTQNVSNTVYVKKDEWLKVGSWVYDNFEQVMGITFLPVTDHNYELAPYEAISETTYNELLKTMPVLDFSKLHEYEKETGDTTEVARTLSCNGTSCELK